MDLSMSCIETHTTAIDPHRTDRIIGNAYMRCVPMTISCVVGMFTNIQVSMHIIPRPKTICGSHRVDLSGNRTRYTLHGSQLPSHRRRAVVIVF
uniref:SFRICE_002720 n=1 Tax=Spodoptera frugiperda TaxID=7108 RepID=A0A2H1VYI2_SPOFR